MSRDKYKTSIEKNLKTSVVDPVRVLLGQVGSESGSESEKIVPDPDLRTDPTILRFDIYFFFYFCMFTSKRSSSSKITCIST
jgi:hypothetical protein